MSVKVDIDPRVLLVEMRARIEFYENRCLILGQENLQLRQTTDVQAKEIEKLKAPDAAKKANWEAMERGKTTAPRSILLSDKAKQKKA